MNLRFIFYPLFICLTAFGCSAPAVFELKPIDAEYTYMQGREVVSQEDSVALTILNFEYQEGNTFTFYTEITNNSNVTYTIDPSKFYSEILEPTSHEIVKKISVVDPEIKIKSIDEDISSTEASKGAAIGMNIIFGVFNAVVDIASEAPPGQVINDVAYWGDSAQNEAEEHDIKIENLQNLRKHWQNNVLRKTTLAPGEYFGGIFYLPIQYDVRIIKLILPIYNTVHEFIFEQKRFN
ncbi:hypothetical protein MNBD_IGNAVI01-610 [hydrothermal vent metagenome]|uniref:Lipoprotein n=1 Tax=hydrothermal vent metagenome TaxID=652676 RepID=A0A3B1CE30_9ZZZZ